MYVFLALLVIFTTSVENVYTWVRKCEPDKRIVFLAESLSRKRIEAKGVSASDFFLFLGLPAVIFRPASISQIGVAFIEKVRAACRLKRVR